MFPYMQTKGKKNLEKPEMTPMAYLLKELIKLHGGKAAVCRKLGIIDKQPAKTMQVKLGQYETGRSHPKPEFIELWKQKLGDDLMTLVKERNVSNEIKENKTTTMETHKNDKVPEEVYRNIIESNSAYKLVPNIILDKYEILSNRELQSRERLLEKLLKQSEESNTAKNELIATKNLLIASLEKEVSELRTKIIQPSQQT